MAVFRLLNAVSNVFWLLDELVAEVADVVSSDRRELVLCIAVIDMKFIPFLPANFRGRPMQEGRSFPKMHE